VRVRVCVCVCVHACVAVHCKGSAPQWAGSRTAGCVCGYGGVNVRVRVRVCVCVRVCRCPLQRHCTTVAWVTNHRLYACGGVGWGFE